MTPLVPHDLGALTRRLRHAVLWAALGISCDAEPIAVEPPVAAVPVPGDSDDAQRDEPPARSGAMALTRSPVLESGVAVEPPPHAAKTTAAEKPPAPIEIRIARQMLVVRDSPSHAAAIRGRIPMTESFEVFALAEGEACGGKGWADVGEGGYVCLEDSRPGKTSKPRMLPRMRDRDLAPFYYAKVPKGKAAHRWASEKAYFAGEPPIATLESEHQYAFVTRKRARGELLLVDERKRVVPEREVQRYRPATFEGRDLIADPVPDGEMLAWTVDWPETPIFSAARDDAELARMAGYHEVLMLRPEPAAPGWFQLADGTGFVGDRDVGRMVPPAPLAGILPDEIWIDVELEEQVLTVMREGTPIFATLISSGFKAPTPRGLFRIRLKEAIGTMASNPGADDPYAVEAVPFIQYFHQGFALHAAYWHNRFGHRLSHGCVNLSPRDAGFVFSLTSPRPRAGWLHSYETTTHLGTTLRVRRGDAPVVDRRRDPEPVFG